MKIFFNLITVLCSLLLATFVCAQQGYVFSPLRDDTVLKTKLLEAITNRYNNEKAALPKEFNKDLSSFYASRYNSVKKYFDDSLVITDKEINDYVQAVYAEIKRGNPALQKMDMHIMLCRAWWPNAACYGEGTILFNIGLFTRLHNEAEMAFVLCHELAHQYFDHGNTAIRNYVQTVNSKKYHERLKEIQNTQYEKRRQVEDLLKSVSFSSRRHGREHESQADSMALVWLQNTPYNPNAAITCLGMLDAADKDKYDVTINPKDFFNFSEYPFQKSWEKEEESFFSKMAKAQEAENKVMADSLKTHPDCKKRIAYLQKYMPASAGGRYFVISDTLLFEQRKLRFDYEILDYTANHNFVSYSIYYSMQIQKALGENVYLITNQGTCLNKMYTAQLNHQLSKIVDMPSSDNEEKYNDFLQFIQKLRLADIGAFSYYYLRQKSASYSGDRNFMAAFNDSRKNINK